MLVKPLCNAGSVVPVPSDTKKDDYSADTCQGKDSVHCNLTHLDSKRQRQALAHVHQKEGSASSQGQKQENSGQHPPVPENRLASTEHTMCCVSVCATLARVRLCVLCVLVCMCCSRLVCVCVVCVLCACCVYVCCVMLCVCCVCVVCVLCVCVMSVLCVCCERCCVRCMLAPKFKLNLGGKEL